MKNHPYFPQFAELITMTRMHLLQEFQISDRIDADPETYLHFKQHALQQKKPQPTSPAPTAPIPLKHVPIKAHTSSPVLPSNPVEKKPIVKTPETIQQIPTSPEPIKTSPKEPKGPFQLEPFAQPIEADFNDLKKIIAERYPNQPLKDKLPCDAHAKAIKDEWQKEILIPSVLILSFTDLPQHLDFLNSLAMAIGKQLAPASVFSADRLENDKGWESILSKDSLRLIIASGHSLNSNKELMKHHREAPKEAKHYLGKIPLFLLADISVYIKNPRLKIPLWADLKKTLGSF